MKLEIGQTVYMLCNCGRGTKQGMTEAKIEKLGRKWLTVDALREYMFSVEDGSQKPDFYSSLYRVFFTRMEYEEHELRARMKSNISQRIGRIYMDRMSLSDLKTLNDIVTEYTPQVTDEQSKSSK